MNNRKVQPTTSNREATQALTVSQLTSLVKRALTTALPSTLHVVGEISNFKRHGGGHVYFTLKDQACELACVLWRSDAAKLKFDPEDGMEVVATGGVEIFERAGRYQLYVRRLEPRGIGALELAFRQLREKLEKQGFFEASRKRSIPRFPMCLAVVTSPTGAAIEDILRTVERRFPCVRVLLFPVRVQGEGAAGEITAAIRLANACAEALGGIDLMIVGRGGGSLEDLWAFNEEIVARAIYQSKIPIISAVGHEVDVTIADLVADLRAATPTGAAESAVPLLDEIRDDVQAITMQMHRRLRGRVDFGASRFESLRNRPFLRDPSMLIRRPTQWLDEWNTRRRLRLADRLKSARNRIDRCESFVARISPQTFLFQLGIKLLAATHRLHRAAELATARLVRTVDASDRRIIRFDPAQRLEAARVRIEAAGSDLDAAAQRRLKSLAERISTQTALLSAVSHERVLARGFSITRTKKGRRILRSVAEVADGDRLVTEVADGEFESQAVNNQQRELFE